MSNGSRSSPELAVSAFADLMDREGMPQVARENFVHLYRALRAGDTGLISEDDIEPVGALQDAEQLPASLGQVGGRVLGQTVVIKLNGGLGTTMGLEQAKSLLQVRGERTFLHIQAAACRAQSVPLVLMNSFATREDSLAAMDAYRPSLEAVGPDPAPAWLPRDFLQHRVPKVDQATLGPVSWPPNPALEWCPPGHGDIYAALVSSGVLARLLEAGYEWGFVSNADNLGAVLSMRILGLMAEERIPFLMEVADRTAADRKGGHLAIRRSDGQMVLRERAQCPSGEIDSFESIVRHRYFNTNSIWLHLPTLSDLLDERGGVLGLPLIMNAKTVDPRDPDSPAVYQLETAMGAAIAAVPGARALRVPRGRFAPVKTTGDLIAVRSDAYWLSPDHRVALSPARPGDMAGRPPDVRLDPAYYRLVDQLELRFPHGPPSLVACASMEVSGDVRFGAGVRVEGDLRLAQAGSEPRIIPSGAVLRG